MKKPQGLTVLLCIAICLCLGACGETKVAGVSGSEEAKVFTYGTTAEEVMAPGADAQTDAFSFLLRALGESLWVCDVDGSMILSLAESMDHTPEALTITLCQDICFSNGNALTAGDVLFSYRYFAAQPDTADIYACMDLDGAEMPDEHTLIIPLHSFDGALIQKLGSVYGIILDGPGAGAEEYGISDMVGTGPYMLQGCVVTDVSEAYILIPNPHCLGAAPCYDELRVVCFRDESRLYAGLLAGELDAARLTREDFVAGVADGAVPEMILVTAEQQPAAYFALRSGREDIAAAIAASGRVDPCLLDGR